MAHYDICLAGLDLEITLREWGRVQLERALVDNILHKQLLWLLLYLVINCLNFALEVAIAAFELR